MKKSTKILLGTSATAAAAFLGFGLLSNKLVLTRASKPIFEKIGETKKKTQLTPLEEQVAVLDKEGEEWFDAQEKEYIVIKNYKNRPLHGYIVKAKEPSDKWAICVHGYTSSPKRVGSYALHHYERGYNILFPVLRGHDISDHKHITMGWFDRLDMLDWIDYLVTVYDNPSIILHGVSMGAATVMMTTGEDLPDNVKCCIADCGFSSVWDEFTHEIKEEFKFPAPAALLTPATFTSKFVNGFGFREASAINQLAKSKTPTLFVHGEVDNFVPYRMMDLNYNAAACPKEKLSIPDADHANSHLFHPEIYWPKVFEFIDKYVEPVTV
ncbi:MAG: alpha/beta hydrolase [Clostridia bacterium]|nr:alpha/beta hydrolase [Clostridia bacterium]